MASVPFGPSGYRIDVAFPQANELATGADVRIAGVNVGTVVGLTLDKQDSRTLATLQISRQYAPIPRNTRATLRIKTLLGETYVELSDGNPASGQLRDGGRLPDGQVAPDVTLDQILATFDPKTRRAFQTWMQAQAGAVMDRGEDINASFGELPAFIDSAENLTSTLNTQSAAWCAGSSPTPASSSTPSAPDEGSSQASSRPRTVSSRPRPLAISSWRPCSKRCRNFGELQSPLALPAFDSAFGERADPVVRAL